MEQETQELLRDALRMGKRCLDNRANGIDTPVEQWTTALQNLVNTAERFLKANE